MKYKKALSERNKEIFNKYQERLTKGKLLCYYIQNY